MNGQEKTLEKKRGRPAIGKGIQINPMFRPEAVEALDRWVGDQGDASVTRAEAIRRLLTEALTAKGYLR